MKRVTASDARRNWFRLLDEVAAGETVCIERGGRRILLTRDEAPSAAAIPDYSGLLQVRDAQRAHLWGWDWPGPEGDLEPVGPEGDKDLDAEHPESIGPEGEKHPESGGPGAAGDE